MIGILLDNLNVPWVEHIYRLAEKMDVCLFVNNYGNIDVSSRIALVSSSYIWSFDGTMIAADTFSARYLYECPIPSRKLFYINSVDWNRGFLASDTLKAASLELVAEPGLAEIVRSVWGPTKIVRNWHYESLQRALSI